MKTSIKTLIATAFTAIVLSSSIGVTSVSASTIQPAKTISFGNYKKILVKGNVEVTLVQKNTNGVSYTEDNLGTAKVFQEGDQLKISSTSRELTKLVVYVNDIYRIEASENAIVKTEGKLTTQFLQIILKGSARADINTSSEGLYTVIQDNADLKLSGSTDHHTLVMGKTQKLTIDKFAALKTSISSVETTAIEKQIAANN